MHLANFERSEHGARASAGLRPSKLPYVRNPHARTHRVAAVSTPLKLVSAWLQDNCLQSWDVFGPLEPFFIGRLSFHLIPCGSRDYALRIARALCSYNNLCACVHAYITYNIPLMLVQWFLPLVHSPFLRGSTCS